jgi:phosphatidylinositol 4-phosphatase
VKQKGRERSVKEAFESRLEELKLADVNYEYFDFAKECSKMKWDRISLLIDRLQGTLEQGG